MTKTLNLALLVCDTPMQEVQDKSGDYPKMFSTVFGLAAKELGLTLTWDFFDVIQAQYPSLEDVKNKKYDAILMSGSKYNAHDNDPWILKLLEFVQQVRSSCSQVRLVGICFGHQIISRALGGITEKNPKGWEIGYTELELTEFGKALFETDKAHLKINQSHQDYVSKIPDGFQCLAYTDNTPYQAIVSDDRQCISVQGHPEFTNDALERLKIKGLNMDDVWLSKKFLEFVVNK
ncbi:hypothetical protein G6F56_006152 [Rhizopus delemar]|nr:hypothetical protein G6F56_006152 [Rhizopus delemar]